MATIVNAKFKQKRGTEASIPVLLEGELYVCTDSNKLYVGTASGNQLICDISQLNDMAQDIENINTDLTIKTGTISGLNGATISNYNLCRCGNMVDMRVVVSGLTTLAKVFFNIPKGFRPLHYIRKLQSATGTGYARFEIGTNGDVSISNASFTISTNSWFELNISYITGDDMDE